MTKSNTITFCFKNGVKLEVGLETLGCTENEMLKKFEKMQKFIIKGEYDNPTFNDRFLTVKLEDVLFILFNNSKTRK